MTDSETAAAPSGIDANHPPQDLGLAFLGATAVLCGAVVLTLEIMGSRVIGPFFGVSLFVWTALITVTLLALAGGYALGGVVADRRAHPDWLYGIIMAAGVLTLVIPFARAPVLHAASALGLRAGSFGAALVLFGPALFALGCVTPFIARLATRGVHHLGRTVGGLYAASTVGSVLGAVLTGYVLIGHLGVEAILRLAGAALLACGCVYFIARRRPRAIAAAPVLLLIPALLALESPPDPKLYRQADGTEVREIASAQSYYGEIKVIDYRFGPIATREMTIDGLVQGGVDKRFGMSIYEYAYFMQHIPLALHPTGRHALVVGLGAGTLARWYASRDVITDVVDIDPAVVAVARAHFGFRPNGDVVIGDARRHLRTTSRRYDFILVDVFNGDTTPGHLLSVEAMRDTAARLTTGGVMALNFVGSLTERPFATASLTRTAAEVFDQVELYPAFDVDAEDAGNIVLVAYAGDARPLDLRRLARIPVHPLAAPVVRRRIGRRFLLPPSTSAIVINDDYNPIDVEDAWLRERVRRQILDSTEWKLLLGAPAILETSETDSS